MSAVSGIRANMLLCDGAQVVNTKLYILGGGWSYLWLTEGQQIGFVVAIDMIVPWDMANRQLNALITLLTEDHEEVTPSGWDGPVQAGGTLVVGRAPEARAGADMHVPLAFPLGPFELEPGGYVCQLSVDGNPVNSAAFQVNRPPQGGMPQ